MSEEASGQAGLEKVRRKCLTRGFSSMKCFGVAFRRFDEDCDKGINFVEFQKGLAQYEVDMDEGEQAKLFGMLDHDRSGQVDFHEFCHKLAPPLQGRRLEVVKSIFKELDKSGDGVLVAEEIADLFESRVQHHPKYQSGEWDKLDVVRNLLVAFARPGSREGVVRLAEFVDYYSTVSACVEDDEYFETSLRACWGV